MHLRRRNTGRSAGSSAALPHQQVNPPCAVLYLTWQKVVLLIVPSNTTWRQCGNSIPRRNGQMARLVQVLWGIQAVQAKKGGNQGRNRLPIIAELVHKMKEVCSHMDEPQMLWAASSLCFFGFFRSNHD